MSPAEKKPSSAREKIARLRVTFCDQLPARMMDIRSAFERLRANAADRALAADLHRLLHGIKGTGRSFGFFELGEAAALGEALAAELVEQPQALALTDWQSLLAKHIDQLVQVSQSSCLPDGKNGVSDDAPAFTLNAAANPPAVSEAAGRLVYLCDDEPLTLAQLASQLACFSYETVSFLDPTSMHDAVLLRRPDAVVMDINFPMGKSLGIEALAALKQETGHAVPAIFLSARDDFAARLGAVQAGGEAYFHKPARPIDLVAAIDELTNQHPAEAYRILIIDDEPEVAAYHGIILQEYGMKTFQLSQPARVLQVLEEFRPDMVLMDMYMPECSGRELATLIRQVPDYIGLPIVYLSSETDRHKQFSAMRVGAEGFLTKPVVPEDLVSAVAIRAERMRTLRSLMARDSLTGLFNHTTTTQLLENAVVSAKRGAAALSFVMIDIDNFKQVNDTHGHPVGDQVILAVSRVLQQRLRNSDVVGRYGGEEFAIILQGVPTERAARLVNELRDDFSRVVFHATNADFSCTFSAGIASYNTHPNAESLRQAADRALYRAKHSGRNCVVVD